MSDNLALPFRFLELPLELRFMIEEYALWSPRGLWMDIHRRDVPAAIVARGFEPQEWDVKAAKSALPIISPQLLRTCKLVYREAKHLIWQNKWLFHRYTAETTKHLPKKILTRALDLYIDRGNAVYPNRRENPPPNGTFEQCFEPPQIMVLQFYHIEHLTIAFTEDDRGLLGKRTSKGLNSQTLLEYEIPVQLVCNHHIQFSTGYMRSISLECPRVYSKKLYPYVYAWTWVTKLSGYLAPRHAHHEIEPLYLEMDKYLGTPDFNRTTFRNYRPFVKVSAETAIVRDLHDKMKEIWNRYNYRVTARNPKGFERGTMIVFECTAFRGPRLPQ